ncbi:MAG: arylsulfotransferase family protein [Solirubrobacteraceae bacterium]
MNNRMRQARLLALLPLAFAPAADAAPVTISPGPGTAAALPGTQISFLGAPPNQLRGVSVVGSATGRHRGRLRGYGSAPGASFIPSHPFKPGEHVTVSATLHAGGNTYSLATSFTVAQPAKVSSAPLQRTVGGSAEEQSFLSAPNLHPPVVAIDKATSTAPGYLFAAPFRGPAQYGPMIFDNEGGLVWFHPLRAGREAADFRVQRYHGQDVLTWWEGDILRLGYGVGVDVIADRHYRRIAVLRAGNGLHADDHDFRLTPQGQALLSAYSPIHDPSATNGLTLDRVTQEIDPETGLVMREWHSDSLGSVPVANPRSVQLLPNGNRLLSGAGLPTFTESDRSGETVLAGRMPDGDTSFGVYRYRWVGRPAQPPAVAAVVQRQPEPLCHTEHSGEVCPAIMTLTSETTVYMSWNGATGVASWRVLAGSGRDRLEPVAGVKRSGFETNVTLPGSVAYVQAQALSANGKLLASSSIVKSKGVNE